MRCSVIEGMNLVGRGLEVQIMDDVRAITKDYSSKSPPFNILPLLSMFDVGAVRERLLDRDARLIKVERGFMIEINSACSKVRKRMSLAHELGHLLISRRICA